MDTEKEILEKAFDRVLTAFENTGFDSWFICEVESKDYSKITAFETTISLLDNKESTWTIFQKLGDIESYEIRKHESNITWELFDISYGFARVKNIVNNLLN